MQEFQLKEEIAYPSPKYQGCDICECKCGCNVCAANTKIDTTMVIAMSVSREPLNSHQNLLIALHVNEYPFQCLLVDFHIHSTQWFCRDMDCKIGWWYWFRLWRDRCTWAIATWVNSVHNLSAPGPKNLQTVTREKKEIIYNNRIVFRNCDKTNNFSTVPIHS